MSETSSIPKMPLLGRLVGAGVLGMMVGLGVAAGMGARGDSLLASAGVLLAVSAIGCVPVLLLPVWGASKFGLVALVTSMLQTLAGAGLIIGAASMEGIARKPVALGTCAGCFVILMLGALVAVAAISKVPASAFKQGPGLGSTGAT